MRLSVTEAGEGPPLILLHGLFGAGQNWGAIRKAELVAPAAGSTSSNRLSDTSQ